MTDTAKGMSRRRLLMGFAPGLQKEEPAPEPEEAQEPDELSQGLDALEQGDYAKAVELLRPHVKENKKDDEARTALGLALYKLGQHVQAKVEFDRLLYGGRRDKLASLYQGLCWLRLDKPDKAKLSFRTYVNPDNDPVQDELYRQLDKMEAGTDTADIIAAVESANTSA